MNVKDILNQPEGRRLEFKESIPTKSDLAKTIIAFANDAGGELYVGIKNDPREVTGLNDEDILQIEEQISNIIFDQCAPLIIPDILSLRYKGKVVLRVKIYKGNTPPYHLKSKGTAKGTYIRVGSTNRLADEAILMELERQKRNISFDAEPSYLKEAKTLHIEPFRDFFFEKTDERLTAAVLKKLNLVQKVQGKTYPSNALLLFSDDEGRRQLFPYPKVECVRFKGATPGTFLDQKTIDSNIAVQAEQAYSFVLRHISQSSTFEGVYRIDRWEYPVLAIREAIRNAIVHRDYSLTGKDIKVAIYDDMVEITSPGKLLPSIDFNELEAGQSDIRNKTIAPVFKRMGIIEQWGAGLRLIATELDKYPEIELKWNEPGVAFQMQFVKKDFVPQPESQPELKDEKRLELGQELPQYSEHHDEAGSKLRQELGQELGQELSQKTFYSKILELLLQAKSLSRKELAQMLGQGSVSGGLNRAIKKLYENRLIEWTIPEKPNSRNQQYRLTKKGKLFIEAVNQAKKGG